MSSNTLTVLGMTGCDSRRHCEVQEDPSGALAIYANPFNEAELEQDDVAFLRGWAEDAAFLAARILEQALEMFRWDRVDTVELRVVLSGDVLHTAIPRRLAGAFKKLGVTVNIVEQKQRIRRLERVGQKRERRSIQQRRRGGACEDEAATAPATAVAVAAA